LLLVIGSILLFRFLQQRRAMIEAKPLTAEERRRAEKLLREM
jgi:cytochrome c-type biogenesis protein CcmH/NrfF